MQGFNQKSFSVFSTNLILTLQVTVTCNFFHEKSLNGNIHFPVFISHVSCISHSTLAQVILDYHLYFESKTDEDSTNVCHFIYSQYVGRHMVHKVHTAASSLEDILSGASPRKQCTNMQRLNSQASGFYSYPSEVSSLSTHVPNSFDQGALSRHHFTHKQPLTGRQGGITAVFIFSPF